MQLFVEHMSNIRVRQYVGPVWAISQGSTTRLRVPKAVRVTTRDAPDADHTGNMSDDVDILTAWTGFQFPNGSPLPTTKTASPGRVAWQLTLKTTDAIATVRGKRQGGR